MVGSGVAGTVVCGVVAGMEVAGCGVAADASVGLAVATVVGVGLTSVGPAVGVPRPGLPGGPDACGKDEA